MLENHFYWSLMYNRWLDERYWPITKKAYFSGLPLPLQFIVPPIACGKVKTQLHQQGTSRHSEDKIYQLAFDDIDSISAILGDNHYIIGSEPCVQDASIYAFLANALYPDYDTPLKDHMKQKPNLVAYCDRMRSRYFS